MKTLDEIALDVAKETAMDRFGIEINQDETAKGFLTDFARRLTARLAQEEPVAWVLWNTVDDEPVMLYGDKPERTDFKKHFELRPLGFYAAPALAPGMVQVPRETFEAAFAYIKHCGANQVMRGEPHPQQFIVDGMKKAWLAAAKEKS